MRPEFAQSLDCTRPHTLLTENPLRSGTLEYRYDDTGEPVLVPNIWYNQTSSMRVGALRFDAKTAEDTAERYERNPPLSLTPQAAANIACRYRERAARIRAEASRMEAAGRASHPVAAARLPVDYGESGELS